MTIPSPLPLSYFRGGRNITNGNLAEALNSLAGAPDVANRVDVYSPADLPDAVGDEITLDPNTHYFVHGRIVITPNVIVGSNIRLIGDGSSLTSIQTVSSKPLIKTDGTGLRVILNSIDLQNFGDGGIADIDLLLTNGTLLIFTCNMQSLGPGVIIRNAVFVLIDTMFLIAQQGLQVVNNVQTFTMRGSSMFSLAAAQQYYGVRVEATAVLDLFNLNDCTFTLNDASDYGVSFHSSASYASPLRAIGCKMLSPGSGVDPSGLGKVSPDFIATDNTGIDDSLFTGAASLNGNVVATITPIGDRVPIGSGAPGHTLFNGGAFVERFSLTGAETQLQRMEYTGRKSRTFNVVVSGALDKGGGGTIIAEFGVMLNGVIVPDSATQIELSNRGAQVTAQTTIVLNPGDDLAPCISNTTSSSNITVLSSRLTVDRVV